MFNAVGVFRKNKPHNLGLPESVVLFLNKKPQIQGATDEVKTILKPQYRDLELRL